MVEDRKPRPSGRSSHIGVTAPGLGAFLNSQIEKAVEAERRACAEIIDHWPIERGKDFGSLDIAVRDSKMVRAICARSALKNGSNA